MNNNYRGLTLFAALVFANQTFAAAENSVRALPPSNAPLKPCSSVTVDAPTQVLLGKSTVVRLSTPASRMVIGGLSSGRAGKPVEVVADKNAPPAAQRPPAAANTDGIADVDVILLSPTELFFIGKRTGSMNVVPRSCAPARP